ncbi:MAG: GNAT family N-acetyltransferase [Acidobacteria bacterium]|nr:GNAT family N-acetyltransferase [Acidobacteriota bacterium]
MFVREVGPGIEMRLFEARDAEELFAVVEANREYLRKWLPWVDVTHSPADLRRFIERVRGQYEAGQGPQTALRWNGRIVGGIGCHPIDWPNRRCSIGYWLADECQGKGIMTRACASLLGYLFDEAGLHRVTIQCGTRNRKSCAIPRRLGFRREGVMRGAEWVNDRWVDLVVWGMLAEDWRARRQARI